jgi:trimethylamine:corrinoid methyltransferase-like protein
LTKRLDKRFRGQWEAAGAETIDEVAKKGVQAMLSKHEPFPLERGVRKQLDEIARREEKTKTI